MTGATLLFALFLTTAADTSGDPVLLDFHAAWCPPCRSMRPAVEKLAQAGYPIRSVDVDQSPELSKRYKIEGIPAYLVVDAQGKVLARTAGAMPASQLAEFYNKAKAKLGPVDRVEPTSARESTDDADQPEVAEAPRGRSDAPTNPLPWETVVRIKMHLSSQEWGFGSGTIVYSDPDKSIILTCAHIFRIKGQQQPTPKNFRVPITVDLFDGRLAGPQKSMVGCAERDIPGEAVDYDFTHDVGLIVIRPGRVLPASPVVPDTWTPRKGMKMYAVGCSHGADATAWDTMILDPYVKMSNTGTKQPFVEMKCTNQPKEGRSGGGLYTKDGYVAGVCDFADPNEKVGLYAVPQAIHRMLDRNSLTALYMPTADHNTMVASNTKRRQPSSGDRLRMQSPEALNPEDVTIPPPSMVGIRTPKVAPPAPTQAGRMESWQRNEPGPAPALASSGRATRRPAPASAASSIDPNAPTGGPMTTDLAGSPDPDAAPTQDAPPRAAAPVIPINPSRMGNWRRPTVRVGSGDSN